jgi:hypothetical protein
VTRVVVKADDQNTGMMASGSDNEGMEVFEVFCIPSENREVLGDRVNKHPRIGHRQQADISGHHGMVPLSPES